MKIKKIDRNIVQETAGDPAFYNDQIGNDKEPVKVSMGVDDKDKKTARLKNANKY